MTRHWLYEDKLPSKLLVIFSKNIKNEIDIIDKYNQNNHEGLLQLHDYLDGIRNYISNPVIAWDYTNRCQHFPNGTRLLRDFDYNVGYTIKTNNQTQQAYVYIFMVNLKPEEFDLKVPPTLTENRQHLHHIYRINESQLRNIIKESIKKILNII